MNTNDLFKMVNNQLSEEDFYPASLITNEEELTKWKVKSGRGLLLYSEVKEIAQRHSINPEKLYFTPSDKGKGQYYYYDFPNLVEILSFTDDIISFTQVPEQIKAQTTQNKKMLKENRIQDVIIHSNELIRILTLIKLYDKLPKEERYETLIEVYTLSDYGFGIFPKELLEDAFSSQPKEIRQAVLDQLDEICDEEELVIYRGVATESTNPSQSYSWTLNLNTAIFFARRFSSEGDVYKAKVKKRDVVSYETGRNEDEIIVRPEHVYNIADMNMAKSSVEIERLSELFKLSYYHNHTKDFDKTLFFSPEGIHGILHMKRVLLHVLSLSNDVEVDDSELAILIYCALYHDIGRINDDIDDLHGERSWQKIIDKGLFDEILEDSDIYEGYSTEIMQFIIENHCLSDHIVWEKLDNMEFKHASKEDVRRLTEIFKDADGLDRVRLGDLNTKYLRTEEAKRRVIFAYDLLRNVE